MGAVFWTIVGLLVIQLAAFAAALIVLRRWMQGLSAILMALRPISSPGPTATFSLVKELPPATPEAALEFFKGAQQSPWWPYLSHRFQVSSRGFLDSARLESTQGHDAAAMFYSGAAWYASREAVMPQREINTCLALLQVKESERQIEEVRERGARGFRERHVH